MKDLFILNEGFKVLGEILRFTGEDENGKTYNVEIEQDDIKAYFGTDNDLDFEQDEELFVDVAQNICDDYALGGTGYNVQVVAQKLKGWAFKTAENKINKIAKEWVKSPSDFLKANPCYTSYTAILG
jgi:hypothetical protein